MPRIKTIFMGSDAIAIPTLDTLVEKMKDRFELIALFTQPDRRTGRGKKTTPTAIKTWGIDHGVVVHQPEKMGRDDYAWIQNSGCELILVMAYGHIIRQSLLDLPKFGFYNLHASILPKLRGASPVETAIVEGEKETGVTLMKMLPTLDAGPVVGIEKRPISQTCHALQLRNELAKCAAEVTENHLPKVTVDQPSLIPQNEEAATYCRLIDKSDGYLDLNKTARQILDHIRGFYPWPGALFEHKGQTIKIGSATLADIPASQEAPGTLRLIEKRLYLKCSDASIEILELQKPGGKMLPTQDFLNGYSFDFVQQLTFRESYPLTSEKYFRKPTP